MKKTITAATLAMVLTLGATFANAGIMISDRQAPATCDTNQHRDGIIVAGRDGIIVAGRGGIIVSDRTSMIFAGIKTLVSALDGILVSDRTTPTCDSRRDGIMISD